MALAPADVLARVVTAWPAGLSGLDALAVDDRGRGAGVAPDPFTICHHERVVYPFKAPVVAPNGEPAANRPPYEALRPAIFLLRLRVTEGFDTRDLKNAKALFDEPHA
jgi:hypothetical protein